MKMSNKDDFQSRAFDFAKSIPTQEDIDKSLIDAIEFSVDEEFKKKILGFNAEFVVFFEDNINIAKERVEKLNSYLENIKVVFNVIGTKKYRERLYDAVGTYSRFGSSVYEDHVLLLSNSVKDEFEELKRDLKRIEVYWNDKGL